MLFIPACYMYMDAQQLQTLVVLELHRGWPRAGALGVSLNSTQLYGTKLRSAPKTMLALGPKLYALPNTINGIIQFYGAFRFLFVSK